MDEMILLVSDEIYPLPLSADNAAVGANKDTAFLSRHISQIGAFSLFGTETQDPAARPPCVAAPIPAATWGCTPFPAKSPVPRLQAGQGRGSCPSWCGVTRRGRVGAPRAGQLSVLLQGPSSTRGSAALGQRHGPDTCGRQKLLWLCPFFRGGLSPRSQGSGPPGAAESTLHSARGEASSPRPVHLLSEFITSPKTQPGLVLSSYQGLRELGADVWLPIKVMWFYHETWKLWLHFLIWRFWLRSRLGAEGPECEPRVCIRAGALGSSGWKGGAVDHCRENI